MRIAQPAINLQKNDFFLKIPPNYGYEQKEKEDIQKITRLGDGVI